MMQNDMNTKAALWLSIEDRIRAMGEAAKARNNERLQSLRYELMSLQDSLATVSKVEALDKAVA